VESGMSYIREVDGAGRLNGILLCTFSIVLCGCGSDTHSESGPGGTAEALLKHGFLGITLVDPGASPLTIKGFVPQSPAEASGLQAGDRLLRVDRLRAPTYDQLNVVVRLLNPGDVIGIRIQRGEEKLEYRVELVGYDFIQQAMNAVLTESEGSHDY